MKKVLLSMFLVLILSGCSIDWNGEKDQKIVKLEKQIEELKKEKENDLFEKNKECSSYYEKIKKEEKEYIWEEKSYYDIESVFYSKKYNSCLYAVHKYNTNDGNNWFIINNYLTKELIYTSGLINVSKNQEGYYTFQSEWKNKIKELKGE